MSKLNDIFEFAKKLTASFLKGEVSPTLDDAPHLSEEEKLTLKSKLSEADFLEEQHTVLHKINTEKDWKKVAKRLDTPVKKIGYWKYAVAASILLLISVPFVLKHDVASGGSDGNLERQIQIGTDKATLTLSTGEEVPLLKGTTFKNSFAESNGEELVYTATDSIKKAAKIVYNYLTIPRGGEFFIELNDGTKVWLNSESKLKFPVHFIENEPRQVELVYGEAYFEVSPSSLHNGSTFNVINDKQNIEVLGTAFNVKAYADEDLALITLAEGKISWSNDQFKEILTPNDQLVFEKNNGSFSRRTVNVYNEISWKDGVFSFKEKSLKDIASVLSRWYDVDFKFATPTLENVKFNGVLSKEQALESILKTIESTKLISSYDILTKTIILK